MTGPSPAGRNGAPRPYEVTARNLDPAAANAIHDDVVARQFGFSGALVPGVELFAYASSAALSTWGVDWLSGGRLALRFRRPVYDGERLTVEVGSDGALALRVDAGEPRAVGVLQAPAPPPPVDPASWPSAPLPRPLPPPVPASLPRGPLGTVLEPVDAGRGRDYCRLVEEPCADLVEQGLAHPGLLLRAVNQALMQNVDLGPWIHTSSAAVLLAPVRLPARLEVRAVVRETSVRGGHDAVRYDALVLADGVPALQVDHTALFRLATR